MNTSVLPVQSIQSYPHQPTQVQNHASVPQSQQPVKQGFFSKKSERVIHTVPISSLDTLYGDPFDTSAIADELWNVGRAVDVNSVQLQIKDQPKAEVYVKQTERKNEVVLSSLTTASSPGWTDKPTSVAGSVLDDMVRAVRTVMPGESFSTCQEALHKHHFDQQKAVNWLKVQRLLRLDLAKEDTCRKVLEESGWDLQKAGEALLTRG